ncbi:MAG: hypothetical protein K6W08_14720 [Firmicutes bacterium]|nr:hypothetical protein [Bacillota bacterium]
MRPLAMQTDRATAMLTGLLLWLCTLPLVGLLVLPWFGARTAVVGALVLLVVIVAACYALCTRQTTASGRGARDA